MDRSTNERIGAELRMLREEAGMKQCVVAARVGKRQPFVTRTELGERPLRFCELSDYARGLDMEPRELYAAIGRAMGIDAYAGAADAGRDPDGSSRA